MINKNIIQYVAIAGNLLLLLFVFELVRRRRIKVSYSLLWIFVCILFVIVSFWRDSMQYLANLLGVLYSPLAFMLILIMAIYLILIQFSVIISKLSEHNKQLAQQLGIHKFECEKKEKKKRSEALAASRGEFCKGF